MNDANKQTTQIFGLIESNIDIQNRVLELLTDIPENATYSAATALKKEMWSILSDDVKNCYTFAHDAVTHCLSLVEWEELAKYYLKEAHGE